MNDYSACFVTQVATKEILDRVTHLCSECYSLLHEGDIIHYDMENYRYLCNCCQEKLCTQMNEACEIIEEEPEASLFC